ncbi:MAG: glycoside hydrolase family 11 protein [Oscillospiraceae bacterium]|nr:glycoside hydrolase family 11 protein [Oscillospiraceae bacterium]
MRKKTCLFLAALFVFLLAFPALANEAPLVFTDNKRGEQDDFDYELWLENRDHTSSMTLNGNGRFDCVWEGTLLTLFRMGKRLGSKQHFSEYGDIILEYGADHTIIKGDVSYLTVYGWTQNPLIEYYIVENHGSYRPGKVHEGTIQVDGATYEVYTAIRDEKPSIEGTKTFLQIFSIRADKRTEGTINVSEHFKAWEELGLDMGGTLYEVQLCIEAYGRSGKGYASVYSHRLTIGDTVIGELSDKPETPFEPVFPDSGSFAPPPSPSPEASPSPSSEASPSPDATPAEASPSTGDDDSEGGGNKTVILIAVIAVVLLAVVVVAIKVRSGKK